MGDMQGSVHASGGACAAVDDNGTWEFVPDNRPHVPAHNIFRVVVDRARVNAGAEPYEGAA